MKETVTTRNCGEIPRNIYLALEELKPKLSTINHTFKSLKIPIKIIPTFENFNSVEDMDLRMFYKSWLSNHTLQEGTNIEDVSHYLKTVNDGVLTYNSLTEEEKEIENKVLEKFFEQEKKVEFKVSGLERI
jgi:uncharacterized protein YfkK (UPF0435 family)